MPAWTSQVPWWVIAAAALLLVIVALSGLRTLLARRPSRTADSDSGLHSGYLVATVLIAASALLLITVAFTMSYAALYDSATWLERTQLTAINGGDLRFLFPLGIDAVIVYFLAMDLVMEWQGRRHPLNRWSAYGLSAITIVLNVSQGEGTTSSYLGHAGPPVVIILIAEGVAAWVRHLAGLAHGTSADRIPAGRWIAHPLSTLKVARLMLGSGLTSYPDALEREQQRQLAYAMLREQYARRWRRATPHHLKWMLDNGYDLPAAFRIIRAMTASRVAMTADEARVLQGDAVPAPAAPDADGAQWRAVPIHGTGEAPNRTGTTADGGAGSRESDAAAAAAGAGDDHAERGHTPVFQAPGPASGFAAEHEPESAATEAAVSPAAGTASGRDGTGEPDTAGAVGEPEPAPESATGSAPAAEPETDPVPQSDPAPTAPVEIGAEPQSDAEPEPAATDAPPRRNARSLPRASSQEKRQRVRQLMETIPDITDEEIAGQIGVAPRTARRYRNEILNSAAASNGDVRVEESEDGRPRLVSTAYGE